MSYTIAYIEEYIKINSTFQTILVSIVKEHI